MSSRQINSVRHPTHANLNQAQRQVMTTTVYKQHTLQPSVHIQSQKSQVREYNSSNPSVSPTVSFGLGGSTIRGVSRAITLKNSDHYEGQFNDKGQFHGYGKYWFAAYKLQYQGYFQNGKKHGKGQLYHNNTSSYHSSGNTGSKLYQKYLLYDGDWVSGQRTGEGKYYYDQDQTSYYQGPWLYDKRHGDNGTFVSAGYQYTGQWKNGKMSGKGRLTNNKSKTVYNGIFQNNQFIKGVINYQNKDQYRGITKNGHRDDNQGRYIYRKKNERSSEHRHSGDKNRHSSHENRHSGDINRQHSPNIPEHEHATNGHAINPQQHNTLRGGKSRHSPTKQHNQSSQNSHQSYTSHRSRSSQSSSSSSSNNNKPTSTDCEKQYVGGWKSGLKHGKCVINYQNGDCSKYAYQNGDIPHTLQCTYLWADGSQFNGWLKRDSQGTYNYDRGTFKRSNGEFFQV